MDNNEENKKIWNYYQGIQRDVFIQSAPRFDFLVRLIKKYKNNGKHLDIGVGDGYLLKKMAKNNFECFGIDIAEESIVENSENFRKKELSIELKRGNISNIPFEDEAFDVITASEVLEHLEDETLKRGIIEITRCLKKGGIFIGTVPADEELKNNLCFCPGCQKVFHKWGHKQEFSFEKLYGLFKENFSQKDISITKIPSIPFKPNVLELFKFRIKFIISRFKPENSFVGSYVIIAMK